MILTDLNIALIKLLVNVPQMMRSRVSYIFVIIRPIEDILIGKQRLSEYFSVDFINLICLKKPMSTIGDALGISS